MLLFSTILDIRPEMTKEKFIALIEEWNETQYHTENIIPDLKWDGTAEYRCGTEQKWIQIMDHQDICTIAVRYEKHGFNGEVWDTDYIFNHREMRLGIQLSRAYEDIQVDVDRNFSTPRIISVLSWHGYLMEDGRLPMSDKPIELTEETIPILVDLVEGKAEFHYPVVFVSKNHSDHDPIDVKMLAKRLRGVAHVLVQPSVEQCLALRAACGGKEEYFGMVGIYLPNGEHRTIDYNVKDGYDDQQYDIIHRSILRYSNENAAPADYTWTGIRNEQMLKQIARIEKERNDVQQEHEEYIEAFDDVVPRLKKSISELQNDNAQKEKEIVRLKQRLTEKTKQPVLYFGNEEEIYTDEIKDILLSVLERSLRDLDETSRRYHVVADIVASNDFQHLAEARHERLKTLLVEDRGLSAETRYGLRELGFEITGDGKHYKLVYGNDARYWNPMPKSGSDHRGGKNAASDIARKMF